VKERREKVFEHDIDDDDDDMMEEKSFLFIPTTTRVMQLKLFSSDT
jgi:hypothetical protein